MQPSRNFDDLKFSSIHRRILLWGSGGPFLDGYVLVMIGVALEQLTPALKLDADWIGLLGAGTLAGLFVGTSLFGYISDKVGRRKMFLIDIIAIGVISVATMFVSSPVELLVMRVLIGIVIGADYPIATSMITEFSSTRQRAFSISFIAAMWYVGATCADLVGYWLYDVEGGWRWMLGSAAIPCLLILIGRFELPESPRWLLRKGRVKECEEMMIKLFGEPVAFDEEQPQQTRFRDLFNRRHFPFVLFVAAIWTCQVIPMFAIYTFGPQIVGLLGLGVGKNAALGNVVISLFFMLGCIPPMLWLNTAGRRPLLIGSFAMMTLALAGPGVDVPEVAEQVEIQLKYQGYIERQQNEVSRRDTIETVPLPADFDYSQVSGLSKEIQQKLGKQRPETLGQASRISGVTPAAIALLLVYLKKHATPKEAR